MRVPHYFFSSGEKSSNTKNYKKCRRSPSLTFPLPARNIVASPLWLKTVTCGLFLRHFVPPRRASAIPTVTSFPRNDKLCRRMRRLITFIRFKPKRTPVPPCHCEERNARRGNLPEGECRSRTRASQPLGHDAISSVSREIPCIRNENNRTRITQILARGGSPPDALSFRASVEKSPTIETKTTVRPLPKYSPAADLR